MEKIEGEEKVQWNWHDSLRVQGAEAVRNEKVRMLALEGVRFGKGGRLEGAEGVLWKFDDLGDGTGGDEGEE